MTEKLKATYEARYCPGIPTDCCDYGVISHETGKEVCRVWDRDDAERITDLLNTRYPTPAADEVETVARAIYLAMHGDKGGRWECVEPRYQDQVWGAYARAAIAALQARSAEHAGEEPVAWASPGQIIDFEPNQHEDGGTYIPLRKDRHGNFTMPLYARPATPTNPERLVDGWRPIDSAPKDGSWFLACDAIDGAHYAAAWDGDENWKANCGQHVTDTPEPTHWMPLPAAPLKEGQGE